MKIQRSRTPEATSASEHDDGTDRWFFLTLIAMVVVGVWLTPITQSLWLDEAGTYWFVKDGLGDAIDRANQYQGQSPAYYLLIWASRHLLGVSEIALRLPSLVGALLATFFVWRLGRRLIGRHAGGLAAVAFVVGDGIAFTAIDARAYALTLAAVTGTALALVRWAAQGRRWDLALFVVGSATTLYLHYIFAPVIFVFWIYALMHARRHGKGWIAPLFVGGSFLALLMIPALDSVQAIRERSGSLSVPGDLSMRRLFTLLAPPVLVGGLLAGTAVSRAVVRTASVRPVRIERATFMLLVGWLIMSPIMLFTISYLTPTKLAFPRYYLSISPAIALLLGWGIASLTPARGRRILAMVLIIAGVLGHTDRLTIFHGEEDWRSATERVTAIANGSTLVLVDAGYVEAAQIDWLTHPAHSRYLLAPLSYYRLDARAQPLPFDMRASARRYLDGLASGPIAEADHVVLLGRRFRPFETWFYARLEGDGFTPSMRGVYGQLEVIEFRRVASAS